MRVFDIFTLLLIFAYPWFKRQCSHLIVLLSNCFALKHEWRALDFVYMVVLRLSNGSDLASGKMFPEIWTQLLSGINKKTSFKEAWTYKWHINAFKSIFFGYIFTRNSIFFLVFRIKVFPKGFLNMNLTPKNLPRIHLSQY